MKKRENWQIKFIQDLIRQSLAPQKRMVRSRIKSWIEKFKDLLKGQKQEGVFGNLVGRLLAYSPVGEDGYSSCEVVRKIIEEYDSDSLKSSYVIAEEW